MSIPGLLQLLLYAVLLILLTKPLGLYMWRVFDGQRTFLSPVVGPLERGIYRLSSVNATQRIPCVLMSSRQSVT